MSRLTRVRAVQPFPLGFSGRATRVSVLGGSSLLLSAFAHSAAGARLPSLPALVVTAAALGLVALLVTARHCGLPLLVALLGAEQFLLHQWFAVLAAPIGSSPCSSLAMPAHAAASGGDCLAGAHALHPGMLSWPMVLGHVAATLALAWLLARGEAWLWRTAEHLTRTADPELHGRVAEASGAAALRCVIARSLGSTRTPAAPRGPPLVDVAP